ncbi:MAG: 3-dehydroquinate synthase [Gemmatimonadetes bacterium]|nr:3-dehydroquinate synthase [Gemmatimonadota bacterium]
MSPPPHAHAVHLPLGPASYDILIGPGLLAELPDVLAARCPAARYAIVSDSAVAPLHGERLLGRLKERAEAFLVSFPAGEWNKTRDTWSALTDKLLAGGLGRDGAVIALGGGVVGDLAGFVAATYLRGIPYVQAPTSLLAMIDSSIGGKTGVDTPHGKNLVGAFHQPRAVVADVDTLATLPPLHIASGVAEALKHGAIADADYFAATAAASGAIMLRDRAALLDLVRRSVEIKAAVVAVDERERGARARLNFGHTVAHALESVSGYELIHGEAVAIGMVAEADLGERLGVTEPGTASAIADALTSFGLPTNTGAALDVNRAADAVTHDKKNRREAVRFAFIRQIGDSARSSDGSWTVTVNEHHLRDLFRRVSTQ